MSSQGIAGTLGLLLALGTLQAADPRPLNVLFLMTDQQHAAALGCAGQGVVKTPHLDRLAAAGTRVANAFCVVPYCTPTRAALLTGRYPSSLGIGRNIDTPDDPLRFREPCATYLHPLAARGYHCHQLGKWHLGNPAELSCLPDAPQDDREPWRTLAARSRAAGESRFDAGPRAGETERIGNVWLRREVAEAHRRLMEEKFRPKQDVGVIGRSTVKPEYTYESVLADYCIGLLERHRAEPFAIVYSVSPPHAPFVSPAPYYDQYPPDRLPLPTTWTDRPADAARSFSARMAQIYGEAGVREYLRCYYAEVTRMDDCIGRILKALDDLHLAERTLVVFTSDHGTMLGQHGMMEKAVGNFYDDLMRVPLIMRLPGRIPAGKTCAGYASSVDLAPTILDYLGATPLAQAHGRSLRGLLEGAPADDRPVFGEMGEPNSPAAGRMIRTREWKLCWWWRGRKALYHLTQDADETHNLAEDPSLAPVVKRLSAQLVQHMREVGDPAVEHFLSPPAAKPAAKGPHQSVGPLTPGPSPARGEGSKVAPPPAPRAVGRRPNILLLYTDQHNARVLGCAGHADVKTPRLDRLAAEGVRFERAYCQDAICQPSRTSLMTGLYPRSTGVLFNGDRCARGARCEPLAAHLQRQGYRTAAFGKRHLSNPETDCGWDVTGTTLNPKMEPSDEYYFDWVRSVGQWEAFDRDMNAEWGNKYRPSRATEMASLVSELRPDATMEAWTARKTIDFIRQSAKSGKPFFCWASFYRPHQPYTPLPEYYQQYDLARLELPASLHQPVEQLPPRLWELRTREKNPWCLGRAAKDESLFRRFLACYYGCLSEIDHHVGQILDVLRETGQAENTIVIYTTDHGDFVGYHGLIEKHPRAHNVYEETLRVPLIVAWPGHVRRGDVRQDLVEQVDLYPTLLELTGLAPPDGYRLAGRSLVPTLRRGANHARQVAISENPYQVTAVGPKMKLGAWIEPQPGGFPDMVFDREKDPLEVDNLVGRSAAAERELGTRIADWIRRTPNATGKPLTPVRLTVAEKPQTPAREYPHSGGRLVWDRVRLLPAPGHERDMLGGKFSGSNVSATRGFEVLAEIKTTPPAGQWTEVSFDGRRPHRWIRYEAPPGSFGRVGKLEFYAGPRRLNGPGFGSIGAKPGGHDWPRVFDAKDRQCKFWMDSDTPDGCYVGIDLCDWATAVRPVMDPPAGELSGPAQVTLRSPTPGAVIRYTLDGTTPAPDGGRLYEGPIRVENTTTLAAVATKAGFAPSPASFATYRMRGSARPGLSTFHIGNSLTGSTRQFAKYPETAGRQHAYQCYLRPGIWTFALWETDVLKTRQRWDETFASLTAVDHFTVQPRDPDVAHEAKYDILFFDLLGKKFPAMQPWFYAEWTARNRTSPWDLGTVASPQMKVFPALTWEESAAARLLYIEDLQQTVLRAYRGAKRPRVLPSVLAAGWIKPLLDEGKIPGLGPQDFDPIMFYDGVHPGCDGAYLIDLTWYAAFYGESPEGKVLPVGTNLNATQAAAFQRLAWDVVKNYPDCGLYESGTAPVAPPQFTPAPKAIAALTRVRLSSLTPGAWFRYTLDGTQPSRTRGYVYCGTISVRPGMTIKAVAYKSGMVDSPIAAATFGK
jgi:arylsulfatase A-like enzyme